MDKYIVFYNVNANNGRGKQIIKTISDYLAGNDVTFVDVHKISDYKQFLLELDSSIKLVVTGGDGTLNYFANALDGRNPENDIFYYPSGTGNDFWYDVKGKTSPHLFKINDYVVDLPVVTVNGKKYRFINGIGYGIDGFVCEEADKIKGKSGKDINYTTIALKGLVYKYKPTKATVTIDGITTEYENVWLAPTMNGRYFGGGMMPTPYQDRLNPDRQVTVMVYSNSSKLQTLMLFPKIFKGGHVEDTRHVNLFKCKHVKISFDKPTALQIDGETILGVTEYEVTASGT